MRQKIMTGVVALLLFAAIAGFFYWRSDRRRMNVLLDEAEHLVTKPISTTPHDGVLKYAGIDKLAAPEVTIVFVDTSHYSMTLTTDDLKARLFSMHRHLKYLSVKSSKRNFVINGDTANFSFLAEVTYETVNGRKEHGSMEISGTAVKSDGKWKIKETRLK